MWIKSGSLCAGYSLSVGERVCSRREDQIYVIWGEYLNYLQTGAQAIGRTDMFRYVPEFILDRFSAQEFEGTLDAYVLLFDIADFTQIGTTLQKAGNQGAEEMSRFLDVAFGTPIEIVQSFGGFVSLFAGDAVCAIFPNPHAENIVSAVSSISVYFQNNATYHTPFGVFSLKIRQTIGYGTIHWQIYQTELQNEYVFYGDTMTELAVLASCKEDVIFSDSAARNIDIKMFERLNTGYRLISRAINSAANPLEYDFHSDAKSKFINPRFSTVNPQNEIRNAAFCFANLEEIDPPDRAKTISMIQTLADKYGGFVNKYDATDKGLIAIILFGLPKSEGKTLKRICAFSLEAIERIPALALGISCGSVFAGFTGSGETKEFTALGQPLNLAARLMSNTPPGEVWSDTFLWQEMNDYYEFNYVGSLNLKGFVQPVRYFRLRRQTTETASHRETGFVSRSAELAEIRSIINSSNTHAIIYVSGDAGIGKTRLTKEALASYSELTHHMFYVTCDAILTKPLEAIKQIVRSAFYYNPQLPEEAGCAMFRALWISLASIDPEMERMESAIASLLGYGWAQSYWSTLPPQEKPKLLRIAFVRFMQQLAKTKPVLIHLDDGQWLDPDSRSYLQALSEQCMHPIITVSPCRYLENGDKVDLELLGHRRYDLELGPLSYSGSLELIKSILYLEDIPPASMQLIFARSMGNPLFIEQLTSYMMESGCLCENGIITGEIGYLSSFSISDIISSHIDRLPPLVQECMLNASVLGLDFDVIVLEQMLQTDSIHELETGIKSRVWNPAGDHRYVFSHILIKDVIYQRMMSDKMQGLHQSAAEAMECVYCATLDEYAEEIATHYRKANLLSKAAEYYDRAGSYYWETFVLSRSELNYQKAIAYWEETLGKQSTEYAESLFHLGLLYHYMRDFTQVESIYKEVLEINENHHGKDSSLLSPYINNLGRFYKDIGLCSKSEQLLIRSLHIEEKINPNSSNVADRQNNLGHLYMSQKKLDQAQSILTEAKTLVDTYYAPDFWFTAIVYGNLGMVYLGLDKLDDSEPLLIRAYEINMIVNGTEHPNTAGSLSNLASLYTAQGRYQEAEEYLCKALDIWERALGVAHPIVIRNLEQLADLYYKTGDLAKEDQARAKLKSISGETVV